MIDSAWQGAPFAIGNDGYLYFCSLDEWVKFPSPLDQVDQRFGELVKIAVLNTNNIWGIDSNGSILNYSPSEFTEGWVVVCPPLPQSGGTPQDIQITSDGIVFCLFAPIGQQNQLFQFDSVASSWKQVASPPDDQLTSFDAIVGGWLFGIGASDNIWEYDSSASSWNQFPNPPPTVPRIISCGEDRTLWVLSEDQKIYQYNYSATLLLKAG